MALASRLRKSLPEGPPTKWLALQPGEIVLEIDGTKVDRNRLTTLLNGPLERQIRLTVESLLPKRPMRVKVRLRRGKRQQNREVSLRPVTTQPFAT